MHGSVMSAPGGTLIGLEERRWDTPTVVRIAGCEQATLLQWRRKYGFLGGAEPGRGRVGYQHSVVDLCLVCVAVSMIEHGIDPADACSDDGLLRAQIHGVITGCVQGEVLGFHRLSNRPEAHVSFYFLGRDQTVGEVIKDTHAGVLTVVDLTRIVDQVLKELGLTVVREAP
jgi:hypothetical protein